MADPTDRVKFPEEKLAELQQLLSDGVEAEKILRSPIWGRIFTSIRETYVAEVVQAKGVDNVMEARARLAALLDLQQVLGAIFTKAKHASERPKDAPTRDVKPRKRVQN